MSVTKRITTVDVARAAGVSDATASYVLSGKRLDKVSLQTQERVRKVAQELGYRPNRVARGLKTQRSYAVGVICTDIAIPLFGSAVKRCQETLSAHGYHVILHNTGLSLKTEQSTFRFLEELCVDGAIFFSSSRVIENEHLVDFAQRVPLVLVNRFVPTQFPVATIHIAHEEAGYQAARHLLSLGCKRLAFFGTVIDGPERSLAAIGRYNGFKRGVTEAGLSWDEVTMHLERGDYFDAPAGYQAVGQLLARRQLERLPDGVYVVNDYAAAGVVRALLDAGLRIPEDVAVVGNDDTELAARFIPTLTSISQRLDQAGLQASQLLLAQVESAEGRVVAPIVAPELIVRESTTVGKAGFTPSSLALQLNKAGVVNSTLV